MNHIKIVVSSPNGSGRSLFANSVLQTFRNAGYRVGLKDTAPDNGPPVPSKTFVMDTIIQIETAMPDGAADAPKAEDKSKELALYGELHALLSKEVDGAKDTGIKSVLERIIRERDEALTKLKEKEADGKQD